MVSQVRARLRGDDAIDSATITTMIMLPTFLIVFLVVVASIMWHSYIRTPVQATMQSYTDLYANLGTDRPARYQSFPVGLQTVTERAEAALRDIVWVQPGLQPDVVCGITDPAATYTITTWDANNTPSFTTRSGIRVPTAGQPMPANSPVTCVASVKLRPWPFQGGWSALNNVLGGSYDAYGTGFSDGGQNANLN